MKKHVKISPTLKTMLHAACLSTAMAVPSYALAAEVGVGVDAGAHSGASTINTRNSGSTGVVTDSRRTGVNATGSVTGTGAGMGTGSITGSGTTTGPGTVNSNTGNTGTTYGGITGPTGMGPGSGTGTTTGGSTTGMTGTTGTGTGSMGTGAGGQMPNPATMPSGLDRNPNQNSQMLPDATRGLERAEDRMNMQGEANEQATVKTKASAKARKNTRNRSNTTTK